MHWLKHVLGLDDAGGAWYLFWSGFFGDTVIFAAMIGFYVKHNCHYPTCKRIGKHVVKGSPYCSKHQ